MDPCTNLLYSPYSVARADMAADLGIGLVAARGWAALTPAAIATQAGVSRQAVAQWFGAQEALRHAIARRFVARYTRWCEVRVHLYGPAALLPETVELHACTRVWAALTEAAARDEELDVLVTAIRAEETLALARHLEREVQDRHDIFLSALAPAVFILRAVVDGERLVLARSRQEQLGTAHDQAAGTVLQARDQAVAELTGASA